MSKSPCIFHKWVYQGCGDRNKASRFCVRCETYEIAVGPKANYCLQWVTLDVVMKMLERGILMDIFAKNLMTRHLKNLNGVETNG